MSGGDERRGWAEEMDAAGPKPRETGDAEAGILRMDGAAANGGQESQEAGTKADERLGQEAADGRQGRKTPAQGTGNGELKGSRTLTKTRPSHGAKTNSASWIFTRRGSRKNATIKNQNSTSRMDPNQSSPASAWRDIR